MKNEWVAINMIAETIDVNIKSVYKTLALAGDTFKCRTQGNNYYCYVFVIKGTMKFQLRQPYQFELAEGQATFLWGNDFETYFFDEETEYFWVYFSLTEKKLMVMRPFSIDDIEGTVKDFHRCANLLNRSTKLDLSRANMIFTKHVLDGIEKMRAEEISSKSYHRAAIEKSVNYIKENLGTGIVPVRTNARHSGNTHAGRCWGLRDDVVWLNRKRRGV